MTFLTLLGHNINYNICDIKCLLDVREKKCQLKICANETVRKFLLQFTSLFLLKINALLDLIHLISYNLLAELVFE